MPKIVDHGQRRDEIALVACRVVADYGFDQATVVRIAREAGYTTGMVAHYFDTKQDIIIAALRLILRRIDERLTPAGGTTSAGGKTPVAGQTPAVGPSPPDLLQLLTEALPVDEQRYIECAFWIAFWGQVSADKRLKRINAWVHREYMRLFERCLARAWPEWARWTPATRDQVLRSIVTFINGLTAGAVVSRSHWPPERQLEQLRLHLQLLRAWAGSAAAASDKGGRSQRTPAAGSSSAQA
jgi:AcrR family transcriptional regulator